MTKHISFFNTQIDNVFLQHIEKISPGCWHDQKTLNGKQKFEKTTSAHIYLKISKSLTHFMIYMQLNLIHNTF